MNVVRMSPLMLKKQDIRSRIMRTFLKFLSFARSFAFCLFAYRRVWRLAFVSMVFVVPCAYCFVHIILQRMIVQLAVPRQPHNGSHLDLGQSFLQLPVMLGASVW